MHNFGNRTAYLMHSKQQFYRYAIIVMPWVLDFSFERYISIVFRFGSPGGCCLTFCAGPAAPPTPAMTSPAWASRWSSLLPRPVILHAGESMWQLTCARLRNRPRLESLPVEVQCPQTKRDTPSPSPQPPHPSSPPVAGVPGPAIDMNVTTATNRVGTMDIIAYSATRALDPWHEQSPSLHRDLNLECT
jgi:hypothetical protein